MCIAWWRCYDTIESIHFSELRHGASVSLWDSIPPVRKHGLANTYIKPYIVIRVIFDSHTNISKDPHLPANELIDNASVDIHGLGNVLKLIVNCHD